MGRAKKFNRIGGLQVRALVNRQVQAWEKRDFALAADDWLPNGKLFFPGGHVARKDNAQLSNAAVIPTTNTITIITITQMRSPHTPGSISISSNSNGKSLIPSLRLRSWLRLGSVPFKLIISVPSKSKDDLRAGKITPHAGPRVYEKRAVRRQKCQLPTDAEPDLRPGRDRLCDLAATKVSPIPSSDCSVSQLLV